MSGPWTAVNDLAETGTYVTGLNTSVSDVRVKCQLNQMVIHQSHNTSHVFMHNCACLQETIPAMDWTYWITSDDTGTNVPSGYLREVDCVFLNGLAGNASNWQDHPCNDTHPFACEIAPSTWR